MNSSKRTRSRAVRGASSAAKLRRVVKKLIEDPKPDAVHKLRTTVRRTEVLIDALGKQHSSKKLLKKLSKIRKRAGRVRDVDVQLSALRSLSVGRDHHGRTQLLNVLQESRSKREKKLLSEVDKRGVLRLSRHLVLLPAASSAPRSAAKFRRQTQLNIKKLIETASAAFSAESLHKFRTQSKKTRYALELEGAKDNNEVVVLLKTIQDSVGDWHDWLNLCETAEKYLNSTSPLLAALKNIQQAKFIDAERTARRGVEVLASKDLSNLEGRASRQRLIRASEKRQPGKVGTEGAQSATA